MQQEETKQKESSFREEEKRKLEQENKQLHNQLEESNAENASLKSKLEQLEKKLQEEAQKSKQVPPEAVKPSEQPVNKPSPSVSFPEIQLRDSIVKLIGGDKQTGEKLLVDLLCNKVLMRFKEKEALFCSGLPLPAFVVFRCLLQESDAENSVMLAYAVESMDTVLRVDYHCHCHDYLINNII